MFTLNQKTALYGAKARTPAIKYSIDLFVGIDFYDLVICPIKSVS